ncbi:helix-turn-helix domain-containing protein [Sphingobacterium athyrii]|uniref:AraC family transcriptional regulator n=1 Tax=Sphingobacterium athyrii TaxID=2152717 RepID=A0A363NUB1_9SPHI|nr:helix-turn-helix domain-containing protein [Sphingobacterium athyrii]PUV24402.1 AraC family transcriptional regulator [Sphingobacterium athyrii]
MNRLIIQFLTMLLLFLCESLFAQKEKLSDFYLIQRQYENLPENDSSALPLVEKLIWKAKVEKNQMQLFLGYTDARYHTPDPQIKLKYADSAIHVAVAKKDDSLLSSAYLSKGVVYYFYLKKYKLALNEYLKAFEKNKKNKDPYYRNKIKYHISVVKSYIGYYKESLSELEEARSFFENEIKREMHPNLMFGNQRGYNNTLHHMAVCYRNLRNFKKSDSLVALGLANTSKNEAYKQEHSYFLKEDGIRKYRKKDYDGAIKTFQSALPTLIDINDFAWLTVTYSYLGKSKWANGKVEEAITDFEKIDSIFNRHSFVLPEVRDVYEDLIVYYSENKNSERALYYTKQLLRVDKVLEQDFLYLSSKIHREYDSDRLLQEKEREERRVSVTGWIFIIIFFTCVFVGCYYILRLRSRKKVIGRNSFFGIILGGDSFNANQDGTFRIRHYSRTEIGQDIVDDILYKLSEFEMNKEFLQGKIKLKSLAKKFDVNQNYLSNVINEHKGASFNRYISELRISYITERLKSDRKYRNYSSETLAKECGIASRTNFSALFSEINGISFTEFINKYKNELKSEII